MKRFPCVLISIFAFFFLILPVSADTFTINLPSNWETFISEPQNNSGPTFTKLYNQATTYISNNSSTLSDKFFIYCNSTYTWCVVKFVKNNYSSNINNYMYWSDNLESSEHQLLMFFTSGTYYTSMKYNSVGSALSSCSSSSCPSYVNPFYYSSVSSSIYLPIYSSYSIPVDTVIANNTYIFTDGTWTYTLSNPTTIPTLKDLYDIKQASPPTPIDDYPLLTSFYITCLDSFSVVVEEFTTNYIYLAIITIFLLITMIYLLKRRFS